MLSTEWIALLVGGCGRGYTVVCTVTDAAVLAALAAVTGSTGLVLALADAPLVGTSWAAVRCDPAAAMPVRSHVTDMAVIAAVDRVPELAAEVRRVLVPGGDVRLLLPGDADAVDAAETALRSTAIRPLRRIQSPNATVAVLIARGP